MLKKINRLASSKDIAAAFARGRTFFNPLFTVKYLRAQTSKRFTVVVSTKVFKNAVDRNRLKRILRERLKTSMRDLNSGDYVIMAKPKIRNLNERVVLSSFDELVKKLT